MARTYLAGWLHRAVAPRLLPLAKIAVHAQPDQNQIIPDPALAHVSLSLAIHVSPGQAYAQNNSFPVLPV